MCTKKCAKIVKKSSKKPVQKICQKILQKKSFKKYCQKIFQKLICQKICGTSKMKLQLFHLPYIKGHDRQIIKNKRISDKTKKFRPLTLSKVQSCFNLLEPLLAGVGSARGPSLNFWDSQFLHLNWASELG